MLKNFHFYLEKCVKEKASQTAFIYLKDGQTETESISYDQLRRKAHAISGYFQRNFEVDDRIILLLPNDISFIKGVLGCMYSGVIPIPLHPINNKQTFEKCKHVLKDSGTNYILSTRKIFKAIHRKYPTDSESWNWIFIEDLTEDNLKFHKNLEFPESKVVFLQYTSGSTSQPKGVRVTHKSLITNIGNLQESFGITKDDIILSWLPFFHDMGIIAILFQAIYTGIKCVIFPPVAFIQSPMRWLRAISKYRATMSGAPNFAYALCAERIAANSEPLDLSCWKQAFCGAEPVKVDTYHKFRDEFEKYGFKAGTFYPGYGMAEATLLISGGVRGEVPRVISADREQLKQNRIVPSDDGTPIISCGVSISAHEIRIVNPESHLECPENEIGEIWFRGDSVADGYWNKSSDNVFKAKIAGKEDKSFLRTGDLGFLDNDELFVTGRLKELIIINGQNYFPKDIEEHVEVREPRIRENCTAAFEFTVEGEKKLAFIAEVRRQKINKVDFQELTSSIRRILSEDMGLNAGFIGVLSTGRLPKTTSGKIQRKLYEELIHKEELTFIYEWRITQNFHENSIAEDQNGELNTFKEWLKIQVSNVLNTPQNKILNSVVLNQYGMDSLSAVGLSGKIEEYLNRQISPTIFYNYPTIDAITNYLFQTPIQDQSKTIVDNNIDGEESNDIAIIGMGVDFPEAKTIDEFWDNLCEGRNSISQIEKKRLMLHSECRDSGFIDEVDRFDAKFFNISKHEAEQMDPQQRLLLQTSYHALEDARLKVSSLKGTKTGVFIGIGNSDYNRTLSIDKSLLNSYSGLGNAFSIAANRLSYFYDFKGPSLAVDTACSSSLVAVHLGANSLLTGESDMALIGGVNLILDNSLDTVFTQAGMLSDDFQCKTFDESANGYVRGEGCGVIIIKRLVDALRDGDTVHAVIKGSAVNQDGITNGITAPNAISQKAVISEAIKKARVDISDLGYIETHGTGTSLGDPIEVNALVELLNNSQTPCYLGSVKANIGHLEFAAGIAGLIKTALCLKHKKIPGNPNYKKLNPLIKINQHKIKIPTMLTDWDSKDIRRAGLSSFGFGGTNAHVVLEEGPSYFLNQKDDDVIDHCLFTISAKSNSALNQLKLRYKDFLSSSNASIADICFSTNTTREFYSKRFATYASSKADLIEKLGAEVDRIVHYSEQVKTAFLFTGQGSQYTEMGKVLYEANTSFKSDVDRCANWLKSNYNYDILEFMFNPEKEGELRQTQHSQVAIFVLEYALSKFMMSVGVTPKILLGHSIGEYAAGCIANVFSVEDALLLVYHRGKFMQEVSNKGVMYSVMSNIETVLEAIKDESSIQIAAYNGINQIVISGEQLAVENKIQKFIENDIPVVQLNVSHAFHSELMRSAAERFHEITQKVVFRNPEIPIVSTLTGKLVKDEMLSPEYWSNQILNSVRFVQAVEKIQELETNVYLELGPAPILTSLLKQILPRNGRNLIYCLEKSTDQLESINNAIGDLFVAGHSINWQSLYSNDISPVNLPLYPFQKEQFWIKAQNSFLNGNIDEIIQQLESAQNFSKEEKELLPKIIGSLREVSSLADVRTNLLHKTSWKKISQVQQSTSIDDNEQLIIITNSTEDDLIDRLANQPKKGYLFSLDILISEDPISGFEKFINALNEAGIDISSKVKIVLALGEIESQLESWNQDVLIGLSSIAMLLKENSNSSLWIITKDGVIRQNMPLNVANSAVWGAAKALALDYPQNFNGIINYSENTSITIDAVINNIFFEQREQYIHLQGGDRFVYRIENIESNYLADPIRYEGNYIVSGGLGSLGLHVAEWLSKKGANTIVLLTRKSQIDDYVHATIDQRMTSGTKILIETCDVRSKESVELLSQRLSEKSIEVNGIVHAAGKVGEYQPEEVTATVIREIINTKIIGATNLFGAFKADVLDFYINFSSIASVWGSKNQMLYATANQYLDAYAAQLRQKGVKAYSVHWGPWEGSNMVDADFALKLEQNGIQLLKPSEALNSLEYILQNDLQEVIVADVDWERFSEVYSMNRKSLLFQALVEEESLEETLQTNNELFRREFEELGYSASDLNSFIKVMLQEMALSILGYESDEFLPENKGFFELGFNSLMALSFKNKIQMKVGKLLPNTLLFEQPTIKTLSVYLTGLLQQDLTPDSLPKEDISIVKHEFDDMSKSDLAQLLAEELKNH